MLVRAIRPEAGGRPEALCFGQHVGRRGHVRPGSRGGQLQGLDVGMAVAERPIRGVKKVLGIDEGGGALDRDRSRHGTARNEITPPEASRRVERGVDTKSVGARCPAVKAAVTPWSIPEVAA